MLLVDGAGTTDVLGNAIMPMGTSTVTDPARAKVNVSVINPPG
jgi:hypothetical protein